MKTVAIVVPTLNEVENIDPLLTRLMDVRAATNLAFSILFVDSNSGDGTCKEIERWQEKAPVGLLCRQINVGLAGAVIAGAKASRADFVVVMDADLSHPPEIIPRLLQPLFNDSADMVIGSRYVKGGSMPDWRLSRRISSRIATLPARLLCRCRVKDPLAGFFALRRDLLTDLPGDVPGFKIALAVLAEYGAALRTREVPIEFRDRDLGQSKMSKRVVLDYVRQLVSLACDRLHRPRSPVQQ